ncbi:MAG TPA: arylesterase [Bryobacteraceae bacterium]|nr:arylesterase [Bryobacteraceae bacterium]
MAPSWGARRTLCAVGLLALLAGCGGSKKESVEAPTERPKEASAPAPRDNRPVIVAFGDSLTAGFGAEPGNSYPDFLQKDLDAAGVKWRVVNMGVSGDTTTDGVNRLNEVLAERPRVVIVEFGGNDGLRGLPIETTRTNLEETVSTVEKSGAKVVLAGMTLPPNYGPEYIRSFEEIYRDLDAHHRVVRIPFLLDGVATKPELMQRDKLHPTAEGNAIVAQTVLRYLRPLLN